MSTQSHNQPQRRPNYLALGAVLGISLGAMFESPAVLLAVTALGILLDRLQQK